MAASLTRGADHTDGEDGSLLQDRSPLVLTAALEGRPPARAVGASGREQGARRALLAAGGLLLLALLAGAAAAVAQRPGAPAERTWSLHERKGFLLNEQGGTGGRQCSIPGGDCSQTKCCEDSALSCFSKHDYWATCVAGCKEGVNPSVNFDADHWDCKVLSAPARDSVTDADSLGGSEGDVAELEMKSDEEDELGAEEEATFDYADGACRDAEPRGKCYKAVDWAMTQGIWEHPEWYEGLKPTSPFKDFQAKLHETKNGNCPKPCTDEDKEAAGPEDEETAAPSPPKAAGPPSSVAAEEGADEGGQEGDASPEDGAESQEEAESEEEPRPAPRRPRQRKRAGSPKKEAGGAAARAKAKHAAAEAEEDAPESGDGAETTKAPMRSVLRVETVENPSANCSWAGDDCSQTRCCREEACSWDFETCNPLVCYKKDDSHASCLGECPEGWDCAELGASPRVLELPPAGELGELHGDLLFCFSVVTRASGRSALPEPRGEGAEGGGDVALSAFQKKEGAGIFGCDGHTVIHGMQHEVGSSSYKPLVDAFIDHWKAIEEKGHYRKYDWVVKVDPDAVFFPDRLRSHLHQLKVPAGARVYVENSEFRYRFLSPLEVLSGEAAELLFSHIDECAEHLGHQGGEDYFLKACLDAIGANHQSAFALLRDGYMDPYAKDPCSDSKAAAFHPYKKVAAWQKCWQRATEAGAKEAGDAAA